MRRKKKQVPNLPVKKRGFKVLEVYFSGRSSTDRDFHNTVGLMRPDEKKIYIEKSLPRLSYGTKQLTFNHELAHARLDSIDIERLLNAEKEEAFVELEAVVRTSDKFLSLAESYLKDFLTKGKRLNPRKREDFRKIVINILKMLGVKLTTQLVYQLSTGTKQRNK